VSPAAWNASRSWACQRTPKGEKQNTPFCRTFGKSDLSGTPVRDTEAHAVLLLLVVDAVYVRTREATDSGPARYPSEPERMRRISNHPRAQGARPVRTTVVRWPIYYPPSLAVRLFLSASPRSDIHEQPGFGSAAPGYYRGFLIIPSSWMLPHVDL
jgi:hypothetical protein